MEFIKKHRQPVILALLLLFIAAAVYVSALYRPGIWYGDTFLAQTEEGFLSGDGAQSLTARKTTDGLRAVYLLDGEQREYRLTTTTRMTEIFEDGRLRFRGSVRQDGNGEFVFRNERGEEVTPTAEGGFPDYQQVYTWILESDHETRGNPWTLVLLGICAAALVLDLAVPVLARKYGVVQKPGSLCGRLRRPLRPVLLLVMALLLLLGFHHF